MAKRPNRRQFLKTGLVSGLSLVAAPLLEATARPAAARVPVNERVFQAVTQPPFTALPSTLPLGQPLADIAMGWDGSVWGIDTNGVPHQYDQVAQTWQVCAPGIDAVALTVDIAPIVVVGDQVVIPDSNEGQPQPLASAWQNLPDSFADGLDGAATANNTLYLFRHGRFLAIDPSSNAPASPPQTLTALANWPTTPIWQAGAIDAVGSNLDDTSDPQITLWAGGEYLTVDLGCVDVST